MERLRAANWIATFIDEDPTNVDPITRRYVGAVLERLQAMWVGHLWQMPWHEHCLIWGRWTQIATMHPSLVSGLWP